MRKELLELIKKLEAEQGARVETTKSGWMVYPPDKSKPGVAIPRDTKRPESMGEHAIRTATIRLHHLMVGGGRA